MNALLIDAYDSFVFLIGQYLKSLGVNTRVVRCDSPALISEAENGMYDFIVLGPGPGRPEEAGYLSLIDRMKGRLPILGVCLGHQAIGQAFGGQVICARSVVHGKTSSVLNDGAGAFLHTGGRPVNVTRYHSLIVDDRTISKDLFVTARTRDDGYIMGLRHRCLPIEGVQFHPESIATEEGMKFFTSFLASHVHNKNV
jgi:anthranilate synthase/aminodeoxychorismate synthase-like glutamine amidotransferase